MSYLACCVLLCARLLRMEMLLVLLPGLQIVGTVQAVLGVGRQAVHAQRPGIQAAAVQLIYPYIKHHYVQMAFKKGDSSFSTTPSLFQSECHGERGN